MHEGDDSKLKHFQGIVRLFPLPNLVFFPGAVQPLHIFEPRYRQLMADTLASDQLMTLVLLDDGWEETYEDKPKLHKMGCLGRVVSSEKLPDGRYNLMLRGISRVQLLEETEQEGKQYRTFQAITIEDSFRDSVKVRGSLRRELAKELGPLFPGSFLEAQMKELFDSDMSLSNICDILAFALPLGNVIKQELLESTVVEERAEKLLECFREMANARKARDSGSFPPPFSLN